MIAVARVPAVACVPGVIVVGAVVGCRRTVIVAGGGGVLVMFGSRVRGLVVVRATASAVFVSVGGRWVGVGA